MKQKEENINSLDSSDIRIINDYIDRIGSIIRNKYSKDQVTKMLNFIREQIYQEIELKESMQEPVDVKKIVQKNRQKNFHLIFGNEKDQVIFRIPLPFTIGESRSVDDSFPSNDILEMERDETSRSLFREEKFSEPKRLNFTENELNDLKRSELVANYLLFPIIILMYYSAVSLMQNSTDFMFVANLIISIIFAIVSISLIKVPSKSWMILHYFLIPYIFVLEYANESFYQLNHFYYPIWTLNNILLQAFLFSMSYTIVTQVKSRTVKVIGVAEILVTVIKIIFYTFILVGFAAFAGWLGYVFYFELLLFRRIILLLLALSLIFLHYLNWSQEIMVKYIGYDLFHYYYNNKQFREKQENQQKIQLVGGTDTSKAENVEEDQKPDNFIISISVNKEKMNRYFSFSSLITNLIIFAFVIVIPGIVLMLLNFYYTLTFDIILLIIASGLIIGLVIFVKEFVQWLFRKKKYEVAKILSLHQGNFTHQFFEKKLGEISHPDPESIVAELVVKDIFEIKYLEVGNIE